METVSGEVDIRWFSTAAFLPLLLSLFSFFTVLQKALERDIPVKRTKDRKMAGHKKGRRSLGFSHHTHDFFPKKVFFRGEGEGERGKRSRVCVCVEGGGG